MRSPIAVSTFCLISWLALSGTAGAQEKIDFEEEVQPILEARCYRCHGARRQRGDLRLDRRAALFEDREPALLVAGKPTASALYTRLVLEEDDPQRMPKGRDPLPAEEVAVVRDWILQGAEWPDGGATTGGIPEAAITLPELSAEQAAREEEALAAVRERGGHAERIAPGSRAIGVSFAPRGRRLVDADLDVLPPLGRSLVWLDLSGTGIGDAGVRKIAALGQLRRLNLARTRLSDEGLRALASLEHLQSLNLHSTSSGDAALEALSGMPALRKLHLWGTAVTPDAVARLRARHPRLAVDLGEGAASFEAREIGAARKPINATCPVTGRPVDAACTLEHEGRLVAFCCAACREKFRKDPALFLAELPARD